MPPVSPDPDQPLRDTDDGPCVESRGAAEPYFSVCIPQWARTDYLLVGLASLAAQRAVDFEICISDDVSPDGRQDEVIARLRSLGLPFAHQTLRHNVRYDANLRNAIRLSRGRYCLLMGNDDALKDANVLADLQRVLEETPNAGVAYTNFEDYRTGLLARRVYGTAVRGAGVAAAIRSFRHYSFVSGVVLDGPLARAFASTAWDGSEMYQTYLATRIAASGRAIVAIDRIAVRKDIAVRGRTVGELEAKPPRKNRPLRPQLLPLRHYAAVAYGAVRPYLAGTTPGPRGAFLRLYSQLYLYPYPYWIIQYRRADSWRFAWGFVLGMRPGLTTERAEVPPGCGLALWCLYLATSIVALATPVAVFGRLQGRLQALAKNN